MMDSASINSMVPLNAVSTPRRSSSYYSYGIGGSGNYRDDLRQISHITSWYRHSVTSTRHGCQYSSGIIILNTPSCFSQQCLTYDYFIQRNREVYSAGIGGAGNFVDLSLEQDETNNYVGRPCQSGADRLLAAIRRLLRRPQD
jgi:hypothetical protein